MRHPFDGINPPRQASRRTWLGMLAAFFGAAAVQAAAPPGNRVKLEPDPEPRPTTLALGEEGGTTKPPRLTEKLGEQGGVKPPMSTTAAFEEGASTRAVGEEGGKPMRPTEKLGEGGGPVPTTLAIGEEGGKKK